MADIEKFDNSITEFVDWVTGADKSYEPISTKTVPVSSTGGLPVSGRSIRELILNHIRKPFYVYEDKSAGLYRMFSSEEAFRLWYNNQEDLADLELFNFVRPSDYEVQISNLTSDARYIISGDTDQLASKLIYTWEVRNDKGTFADSITATYTITNADSTVKTFSEMYNSTQHEVNVDVYNYLNTGQNIINVYLQGSSTGATTSISFVIVVLDLELTSTFEFNAPHIYGENLNIPVTLKRNDSSRSCSIYVYVDGTQVTKVDIPIGQSLEYSQDINILNSYAASTILDKQVGHNLQLYAETEYNNNTFRSNILYYTFETTSADAIINYFINVSNSFNNGIPPFSSFELTATQYLPVTLSWGYYTDQLQNNTSIPVTWKLVDGEETTDLATMTANSGRQSEDLSFIPTIYTEEGVETKLVAYFNSLELISIPINIAKSTLSIYEAPIYSFKISAYGKTNSSTTKAIWNDSVGNIAVQFNNISFNDNSGYYENSFRTSGITSYAEIPYNVFQGNPSNGRTIEFEFESEKVTSTNDIILLIGNPSGARIEVTPNKATLYDRSGTERIHTNFKANERVRLAFIINEQSTDIDSNLLYIVNNGGLERGANGAYDFSASDGSIIIGKSASGVKFFNMTVYMRAITYTDSYNNWIFNADNKAEIIYRNNVIDQSSQQLDYNLCCSKLDVILISGDLTNILNKSTSKEQSVTNATIERFCPYDASKNFKAEECQIRKHGQSTLNYPITSMKIWFNKDKDGNTPKFTCESQSPLGLAKNRYKMKDTSIPANKFILQANYADSSGVHNGGLQRLIQSTWYNAQIDGEYKLRTVPQLFTTNQTVTHNSVGLNEDGTVDGCNEDNKQWGSYFRNNFPYQIEISPDSFPCVVFYRNTAGDNKNIFLGQYVFMEDKKSDFCYGERSIYKAAANDPFCLTTAHKSEDTKDNKIWDNNNVLRIEVLNINSPFSSYLSLTDDNGVSFEDKIINTQTGQYTQYRWEQDFELIYPDPDDVAGNESKGTDKFGPNSKFLRTAQPFIDWYKWLVSTYQNQTKFQDEAAQHIDLYKMAAYYIFALRFGLVDSMERNVQIKSYDGIHFHYEPWDMDIALGNKNTGGIAFDPPIDRNTTLPTDATTYAMSGRTTTTSNWLWDALEAWPYWINVTVPQVAQALYQAGLTYDNITKMFDEEYASKWCEIIYNESNYFKYVQSSNRELGWLEWLQGARTTHRHWWVTSSMDYYDAKWAVGDFKNHYIYIGGNKARKGFGVTERDIITVIPTSPTYITLAQNYDTIIESIYCTPDKPAEFDVTTLEVSVKAPLVIYGALYIASLDLSCMGDGLDQLELGGTYSKVLGAPMKTLIAGRTITAGTDAQHGSVKINGNVINLRPLDATGNDAFENLETLNLVGQREGNFDFYSIREQNRSQLRDINVIAGLYSSFYSSKSGNDFNRIDLPGINKDGDGTILSQFTTLNLNNSTWNELYFWNSTVDSTTNIASVELCNIDSNYDMNIPASLTSVTLTGTTCEHENSKDFILNWIKCIRATDGNIGDKTLILDGINWSSNTCKNLITYEQLGYLAQFNGGNNKPDHGTMKGYLVLGDAGQLTSEQLTQIRQWFGESVFNKNSSGLVIDQELDYIQVNVGADAYIEDNQIYLEEGKHAPLSATKFALSESDADYNWFLRAPGSQYTSSIYRSCALRFGDDGIPYLYANENVYGNYDVQVLATLDSFSSYTTVHIIGVTYPTSFTFNSKSAAGITSTVRAANNIFSYWTDNSGAEFYVTPSSEDTTATVSNVYFTLKRDSDNTILLNNVSYQVFKENDTAVNTLDQYLSYRKSSTEKYGMTLLCTAVGGEDDIYDYTLTANIDYVSGKRITTTATIKVTNDSIIILSNDGSDLYTAVAEKYAEINGYSPVGGRLYKSDLATLNTDLVIPTTVTNLKTQNNNTLLKYLMNLSSITMSSINDEYIDIDGVSIKQLDFSKMVGLTTISFTNSSSSKPVFTIDLTNCNLLYYINMLSRVNAIIPNNINLYRYFISCVTEIYLNGNSIWSFYNYNSNYITSIDLLNVNNGNSFTLFGKIYNLV